MSKRQFHTVFYFNFHLGKSAAETVRQINKVWGPDSVEESTVLQWFMKFNSGDFSLENAPHSSRPTVQQDDKLRTLVEANLSQTARGIEKDTEEKAEDAPPMKRGRGRSKKANKRTDKNSAKATKAINGVSKRGRKKKKKEESAEDENEEKSDDE